MPNVMAAQPNIGGALCESSVIPFLVPREQKEKKKKEEEKKKKKSQEDNVRICYAGRP